MTPPASRHRKPTAPFLIREVPGLYLTRAQRHLVRRRYRTIRSVGLWPRRDTSRETARRVATLYADHIMWGRE